MTCVMQCFVPNKSTNALGGEKKATPSQDPQKIELWKAEDYDQDNYILARIACQPDQIGATMKAHYLSRFTTFHDIWDESHR